MPEQIGKVSKSVIYLAGCAVKGEKPDITDISEDELNTIYRYASAHLLSAAVATALESAGLKDDRSQKEIASAVRKSVIFSSEFEKIREKFAEAHIWYMPLKGAVLKDYYPSIGMRQMADYDILVDSEREEDVRNIMESLGFDTMQYGVSNHDVYHKAPVLNFEIHTGLFGTVHEAGLYNYYRDIETKLTDKGEYEKCFSPEDFYIYLTAHEYKHYSGGGTGLRSLLDTYVYLKREELDLEYVERECAKLGIEEFEKMNRSLALRIFEGEALSDEEAEKLSYFLSSGVYGSIDHKVENKLKKTGWSKIKYMIDRFSVPVSKKNPSYAGYASEYPLFYRHRILLPALPFYRAFRSMKKGKFLSEARAIRKAKK